MASLISKKMFFGKKMVTFGVIYVMTLLFFIQRSFSVKWKYKLYWDGVVSTDHNNTDNNGLASHVLRINNSMTKYAVITSKPIVLNRSPSPNDTLYKKQDHIVNNFIYKYLIEPPADTCTENTSFVILVSSKGEHYERRAAIRKSWGSLSRLKNPIWPPNQHISKNYSLIFVTAMDKEEKWDLILMAESLKFKDILKGNFIDDYQNMTHKSLLGLKYVAESCKNVDYLVKSDDDMFLHIPYLIETLYGTTPVPPRSIIGPLNQRARVKRQGKWELSFAEFPFAFFPPYESGAAYIISGDITNDLYITSRYVKWLFIDDVYVTGILAQIIKANHVQSFNNRFARLSKFAPNLCAVVKKRQITFTNFTPYLMQKIWAVLQGTGKLKC